MINSGFLLSYIKYGDNDAILHCFVRDIGFHTYFVKGIYSAKNKKKAYLSPLNEIYFSINHNNKKGITNISKIEQAKILEYNDNAKMSTIILFLAEFLYQVLKKESYQENIYQSIKDFSQQISLQNYHAHFIFLVYFLKVQGIAPLCNDGDFLNIEKGYFQDTQNHELFDVEISVFWKKILSSQDNVYSVKIKQVLKSRFLDSILMYYFYHFPDFKIPKSLNIFKQFFSDKV